MPRPSVRFRVHSAPAALVTVAAVCGAPGAALAAPTRGHATSCHGALSRAATADEPNALSYLFSCNGRVGGYTIIVNRRDFDFETVDDFSPTASVLVPGVYPGGISPAETFSCQGAIPGAGFNCNGDAKAGELIAGTFDPSDPYCGGVAAGAKPGTPALPRAAVELVVSDDTGAQDGPFRLNLSPACRSPKKHTRPRSKGRGQSKGKSSKHRHNHAH